MSALALLENTPTRPRRGIDHEVTNACRCSTYHRVRKAIHLAADLMKVKRSVSVNRREFLSVVAAAQGAFVLGFWVPSRADAQAAPGRVLVRGPRHAGVNAWVVIAPDDTVTIRIAQTELGQGVLDLQRYDGLRGAAVRLEQGAAAVRVGEP